MSRNVVIEVFDNGGRGTEWISKIHAEVSTIRSFVAMKKREYIETLADIDPTDRAEMIAGWGSEKLDSGWTLYGEDGGEYFGYAKVMSAKKAEKLMDSEVNWGEMVESM